MDDVHVVDTRRAPELVLAEARRARATAGSLHLVVHPATVGTAARVLVEVEVDRLVAPSENGSDAQDPATADEGGEPGDDDARHRAMFSDDSLTARLRRGLAALPEDAHGPERPLPGHVLVLRLDGLSPTPRGVADLLERRLHALWGARLGTHDQLVRVDHELAVAVVHGDLERVDELRAGWGGDAAAFAPSGAKLVVRLGVDAPDGADTLLASALRAADDAACQVLDAEVTAVGDDLLDGTEPTGRPADPVRRAVLRATSARLAARRGLSIDPGTVAAIVARDLATAEGLDHEATTRLVAAARWHLLRTALVTSECGGDVGELLDGPPDRSRLHELLAVATREASRRTAAPRSTAGPAAAA